MSLKVEKPKKGGILNIPKKDSNAEPKEEPKEESKEPEKAMKIKVNNNIELTGKHAKSISIKPEDHSTPSSNPKRNDYKYEGTEKPQVQKVAKKPALVVVPKKFVFVLEQMKSFMHKFGFNSNEIRSLKDEIRRYKVAPKKKGKTFQRINLNNDFKESIRKELNKLNFDNLATIADAIIMHPEFMTEKFLDDLAEVIIDNAKYDQRTGALLSMLSQSVFTCMSEDNTRDKIPSFTQRFKQAFETIYNISDDNEPGNDSDLNLSMFLGYLVQRNVIEASYIIDLIRRVFKLEEPGFFPKAKRADVSIRSIIPCCTLLSEKYNEDISKLFGKIGEVVKNKPASIPGRVRFYLHDLNTLYLAKWDKYESLLPNLYSMKKSQLTNITQSKAGQVPKKNLPKITKGSNMFMSLADDEEEEEEEEAIFEVYEFVQEFVQDHTINKSWKPSYIVQLIDYICTKSIDDAQRFVKIFRDLSEMKVLDIQFTRDSFHAYIQSTIQDEKSIESQHIFGIMFSRFCEYGITTYEEFHKFFKEFSLYTIVGFLSECKVMRKYNSLMEFKYWANNEWIPNNFSQVQIAEYINDYELGEEFDMYDSIINIIEKCEDAVEEPELIDEIRACVESISSSNLVYFIIGVFEVLSQFDKYSSAYQVLGQYCLEYQDRILKSLELIFISDKTKPKDIIATNLYEIIRCSEFNFALYEALNISPEHQEIISLIKKMK